MNFFKNKFKIGSFITVLLALFLVPIKASAQLGTSALIDFLSFAIRGITYLLNVLVGYLISMGSWLVNFALDLNSKIVGPENEIVEVGWQISRDVANLGFVLIIIIIAIATILRYQDYGAKKLLPKLIGAALIVNFSLAMGIGIINFADTFTNFFINTQIEGDLGEVITSAFGPHNFYTSELTGEETQPIEPPDSDFGFGAALVNSVAGMVFSTVFMIITFVTLLGLAVMLVIRFIYLSFLLILAPVALLLWASPGLKHLFDKWWNKFLKWVFFAPIVSFFVYISLLTAEQMSSLGGAATSAGTGFSGAMQDIIIQGSQMFILAGLMIGGLIAADSLSINGAGATIGGMKGAWGKIKGKASGTRGATWRKAKQWTGSLINKKDEHGKSRNEKIQEKAAQGSMLAKTFARPMANLSKATNEDVMKEHDDALKDKSVDQTRAVLNTTRSTPRKIAALNKLVKEGKIDKENASKHLTPKMKENYERFDKRGDFKKLEKAAGMSVEMNEALKNDNPKKLKEESTKYAQRFKRKDMKDMPWDKMYKFLSKGDKGEDFMGMNYKKVKMLSKNIEKGVAAGNSSLVSSILPQMSATAANQFKNNYDVNLKEEIEVAEATTPEGSELRTRLKKARDNFDKIIDNYDVGFYGFGDSSSSSSGNSSENNEEESSG